MSPAPRPEACPLDDKRIEGMERRLAAIEVAIAVLTTQLSHVLQLEQRVRDNEAWRWRGIGVTSAVVLALTLLLKFLPT